MNSRSARALVVEDDRSWQQILAEILLDCSLEVDVAGNLEDAVSLLKNQSHRLAVVDLSLSEDDHNNYDGLRVLDAVRRLDPGCRTILLTGFATVELAVSVLTEYNAFTFLRKENFQRAQFRENVFRALASAPLPSDLATATVEEAASRPGVESEAPGEIPGGAALVVEDDAGWRSILGELLGGIGYQVHLCSSYAEALGRLHRRKYDLAIIDLSLTGSAVTVPGSLDGYRLLASTRAGWIPTIVVSGIAEPTDIERAYSKYGIFAYLQKQTFSRQVFLQTAREARQAIQLNSDLDSLTKREREVLDLLAKGLTNKEIADSLVISTNTVKRHLKAVFEKLEIHTRSAAAARVIGGGLQAEKTGGKLDAGTADDES